MLRFALHDALGHSEHHEESLRSVSESCEYRTRFVPTQRYFASINMTIPAHASQ